MKLLIIQIIRLIRTSQKKMIGSSIGFQVKVGNDLLVQVKSEGAIAIKTKKRIRLIPNVLLRAKSTQCWTTN